jgi:hypothetical protein
MIISVIECVSAMSIIVCLFFFEEAGQDRVTVTSTLSESHKVERFRFQDFSYIFVSL